MKEPNKTSTASNPHSYKNLPVNSTSSPKTVKSANKIPSNYPLSTPLIPSESIPWSLDHLNNLPTASFLISGLRPVSQSSKTTTVVSSSNPKRIDNWLKFPTPFQNIHRLTCSRRQVFKLLIRKIWDRYYLSKSKGPCRRQAIGRSRKACKCQSWIKNITATMTTKISSLS